MKRSLSKFRRRAASHGGRGRRLFRALLTSSSSIALAPVALCAAINGTAISAPSTDPPVAPTESATAVELPAPATILKRSVEAIGGRDAWLASNSRTITMRIEIRSDVGPQGMANEASGTMVVQRKAPDRMLSRMRIEGVGEVRQGFVDGRAWTIGADGRVRELTGPELAERKREACFDRELRLAELYDRVETVGQREFEGEQCWLLRFTSDDGAAAQAWYSVDSGLMRGFARRLTGPSGTLTVVQVYSDHRDFGGRRVPGRITQTVGQTTQTLLVESIDDTTLDDDVFVVPPELPPPSPPTPPAPPAAPPPPATQPPSPRP